MNYIYCITNLINNKRYVGKTTQSIEERFKEHCKDSQKERCEKRPLYDAMNKYGVENFIVEELEQVEDENLLSEREVFWINELGTYGSNGYNASKGGDGAILYDYKEIIQLANLGYTSNQIENKVGCCKSTIYKILKAHNCKLRKSNCKLIAQYDMAGNYIQTFFSAQDAISNMKELSEIIQELVDSSNSMNQIDSKTAIVFVTEAYESGIEKARSLITNEHNEEDY